MRKVDNACGIKGSDKVFDSKKIKTNGDGNA